MCRVLKIKGMMTGMTNKRRHSKKGALLIKKQILMVAQSPATHSSMLEQIGS